MKVVCIGDSLTQGDYGVMGNSESGNVRPENYPYFLAKYTGWTVLNRGICGMQATTYLQFYKNGHVDVTDSNVVIIMLGTNGGNDPVENTPGNDAYRELVKLIRQDAPETKIILCTPPPATVDKNFSNYGYMPRILKAVAFVEKLAKEESLDLIDVHNCGYFTPETERIMQPNDGLHFGEEGYKTLAKVIEQGIRKICNIN